ncbi:hypothetical protein MtrunA17_Chr2g0330581 [Medicago truncatula]|uniref:Transmembrane protein n=1 Tax=Medicago truncatula TaxID=3880 RepID=G7IUL6_MEDTR|nr:hypothetical protein MTR_2g100440 [Medicago truncatula]RHN76304.1 hypothetical protein MtrunA17_Chr2g0330581 [Medicago truncatula]
MATNSLKFTLVTIFIFAMTLSPTLPCDAVRVSLAVSRPVCPACVCCSPPPLGSCCKCCASPIQTQTIGQSP